MSIDRYAKFISEADTKGFSALLRSAQETAMRVWNDHQDPDHSSRR